MPPSFNTFEISALIQERKPAAHTNLPPHVYKAATIEPAINTFILGRGECDWSHLLKRKGEEWLHLKGKRSLEDFRSNIRRQRLETPSVGKVLIVSENDMSKWKVDVENKPRAFTLLEWGVAVGEPYHVLLRIGYAVSKWEWDTYKDTDRSPHQLQTAMSPTAAKELGALLILYAEEVENQVPTKGEQN